MGASDPRKLPILERTCPGCRAKARLGGKEPCWRCQGHCTDCGDEAVLAHNLCAACYKVAARCYRCDRAMSEGEILNPDWHRAWTGCSTGTTPGRRSPEDRAKAEREREHRGEDPDVCARPACPSRMPVPRPLRRDRPQRGEREGA